MNNNFGQTLTSAGVTLKIDQGHETLNSFPPQNNVSMQVW